MWCGCLLFGIYLYICPFVYIAGSPPSPTRSLCGPRSGDIPAGALRHIFMSSSAHASATVALPVRRRVVMGSALLPPRPALPSPVLPPTASFHPLFLALPSSRSPRQVPFTYALGCSCVLTTTPCAGFVSLVSRVVCVSCRSSSQMNCSAARSVGPLACCASA